MKNYLFTENDLDEYNEDMMRCVLTQLKTDWINSDIICKKCGEKMNRSMEKISFLLPPQFIYKCEKCGYNKLG